MQYELFGYRRDNLFKFENQIAKYYDIFIYKVEIRFSSKIQKITNVNETKNTLKMNSLLLQDS